MNLPLFDPACGIEWAKCSYIYPDQPTMAGDLGWSIAFQGVEPWLDDEHPPSTLQYKHLFAQLAKKKTE